MNRQWTRVQSSPFVQGRVLFRVAWTFLVLGLASSPATFSHADDPTEHQNAELKTRFMEEAPQAWAAYLERSQTMRGRIKRTFSHGGDRPPTIQESEVTLNGELAKEIIYERDGTFKISARNPEYAFILIGQKESNVYSIGGLEQHGSDPVSDSLIEKQSSNASYFSKAPVWLLGVSLAERQKNPAFEITKVASVQVEGEDLVRIDYDYHPLTENSGSEHPPIVEMSLVLDPHSYWVIREYRVRQDSGSENIQPNLAYQKSHSITKQEYRKDTNGFPLLLRMSTVIIRDGEVVSDNTMEIEELSLETTPETEFYLSHYGLPEPNFERSWYQGMWLTYLLGGAACFGVAYWLRQRRLAVT